MTIPISYSDKLDCHVQYKIFSSRKKTRRMQWLRLPAFLAAGSSNIAFLILRTASVAELTIRGFGCLCFSNWCLGKAMLKRASIRVLLLPLGFLYSTTMDTFAIIENPRRYILKCEEMARRDLFDLENGTFSTLTDQLDLEDLKLVGSYLVFFAILHPRTLSNFF